ncbi:MAG: tRNA (adenosine(37)-N6)-threonylcarbamoyltransferase complex dimerization subunit type 1 TsaB [Clostridiales bacterium]|nr:tRNA (adenosine(37)-N6)-threonylcarbamoyltransferase complex dimerization subunit type 1 TsaB [Clostridiales bacterium]
MTKMKILYIDTTTPDLVVAVVEDNKITDVTAKAVGVHHSEMLCDKVTEALHKANVKFADLSAYACAIGPGSFTGIRIGVSTVKGYCTAVELPVIGVNCLEAISVSSKCGARRSAIVDAGNGYYFADYANGVAPCLVSYDDERVSHAGRADSAVDYFDGAVELIRKRFSSGQFDGSLTPLYIRRSQAEEKFESTAIV